MEQKVVEEIIDDIEDRSTISYPDQLTSRQANDIQKDTLLYPLDSLIHTLAAQRDCVLVTFDSELIDHGAHSPEDVLEMF